MSRFKHFTGKLIAAALLLLFAGSAAGCAHHRPARVHHARGTVVVVKKGHVHSARCGHYRHNGRWYYIKGHVHGARCGHKKVNGVWVVRL
ncbi:MAG TPA: hypothetical protein ENJ29_09030 [Bacteroidetes bacterium]|nr:hypothetical protein [Bacteroidota bacterium]